MSSTVPLGYTYLEHLGKGGQGTVSKVQRISDGQILAMKQVDLSMLEEHQLQRLHQEVKIHRTLNNRYVVKLIHHQYDWENNFLYTFMDICDGIDLDKLIQQHRDTETHISESEIWRLLAQIVVAVRYCHYKGVLHRDLKPENIFLTRTKEVRLGDLGYAAKLRKGETVNDFVGTPEYAAPETLNREAQGKAADVYGIGTILLEMCTLEYAVTVPREGDAIRKKVNAGLDTTIPEIYSPELQELVHSLLSVKASERPTTHQLLLMPSIRYGLEQVRSHDAHRDLLLTKASLEKTQKELQDARRELLQERENLRILLKRSLVYRRKTQQPIFVDARPKKESKLAQQSHKMNEQSTHEVRPSFSSSLTAVSRLSHEASNSGASTMSCCKNTTSETSFRIGTSSAAQSIIGLADVRSPLRRRHLLRVDKVIPLHIMSAHAGKPTTFSEVFQPIVLSGRHLLSRTLAPLMPCKMPLVGHNDASDLGRTPPSDSAKLRIASPSGHTQFHLQARSERAFHLPSIARHAKKNAMDFQSTKVASPTMQKVMTRSPRAFHLPTAARHATNVMDIRRF